MFIIMLVLLVLLVLLGAPASAPAEPNADGAAAPGMLLARISP